MDAFYPKRERITSHPRRMEEGQGPRPPRPGRVRDNLDAEGNESTPNWTLALALTPVLTLRQTNDPLSFWFMRSSESVDQMFSYPGVGA
jgi:hypothetical protein